MTPPTSTTLIRLAILAAAALIADGLLHGIAAQPGWRPGEMVTYADSRNVRCLDIGRREVYFATEGGVWRYDRATGRPLEPWFTGVGFQAAVPLSHSRVVLWHRNSGTLWLAGSGGLKYWRADREQWNILDDARFHNITSLGESPESVWVSGDADATIDPFTLVVSSKGDSAGGDVRWSGKRGWSPHEFPPYAPADPMQFFRTEDGSITDRTHLDYQPVYDLRDDLEQRHYICYPGLGIAVANMRTLQLELYQPGPAGSDVKAVALADGGVIWIGGENDGVNGGFGRFDRNLGQWERFDRSLEFGMESDRARTTVIIGDSPYFGTDAGLVFLNPTVHGWSTLDRFDGLSGPGIRALALAGGWLFAGGDRGVNLLQTPEGPIFKTGDDRLNDLRTWDMASEGDTVWIAGIQGVFQGTADGDWKAVAGESIVGDEPARCVAVDPNYLWIGGRRGIRRLDRQTGEWQGYLGDVYLRGARPLSLVAADSLLWIGTDAGLYRFNDRRGSWIRFGVEQGLPDERIQRLVREVDTLWLGSARGLTKMIWNRPERDGW